MRKILVISPHPDDAEFALGASIARWVTEGARVVIAVVTGEGDLSMVHSGSSIKFSQRTEEQMIACAILGATAQFLNFAPASKFDTVPQAHLVSALDLLVPAFTEVYAPLPSHNIDHEVTWKAVLASLRPSKADGVQVYAYEQATQEHGMQVFGALTGRKYLQVTPEHMEKKVLSLRAHKSQLSGREALVTGLEGIRMLARKRGMEIGVPMAEMVYQVREVSLC